ncbi:hypothetical protein N7510_000082 [Penicillium lagena]|uniref:uncharacterized protein n=1 Tax=Penicillium lagena TaxID=94218 RepID=UPI00253F6771|nr:uncharacterized protein N7510_000082 [Penicillium lagena]KAJ5623773.1 hypothetical protein N7510_000082 [Penicillium lagena]
MPLTRFRHSKDPDAMVAQLLKQFQSSKSRTTTPISTRQSQVDVNNAVAHVKTEFAIHVPSIDNPEDYEFLPGHFAIESVLEVHSDEPQGATYTVKLQSGELERISYSQLSKLKYGLESLADFRERLEFINASESSEDEIRVVGRQHLMPSPFFSTDGTSFKEISEVDSSNSSITQGLRLRPGATSKRSGYARFFHPVDSNFEDSASDVRSTRARRRLRRAIARTNRTSDDSDMTLSRDIRTSARQRKPLRANLRERLEDDISEGKTQAKRRPKFTGAKEAFYQRPLPDDFRNQHCPYCSVCNIYNDHPEKGPLVFCQGCTSSYHQFCLGRRANREHLVTKIDQDDFILQCHRCLGVCHTRHDVCPHLGCCAECKEKGPMSKPLRQRLTPREEQQLRVDNGGTDPVTVVDISQVNNVNNVLFRCIGCQRAFHMRHLPVEEGIVVSSDIEAVFAQYSLNWQCRDCSDAPGDVEGIVAWRPANPEAKASGHLVEALPETDKEYLVKWKKLSYFRATWQRGDWFWGVSRTGMRRAFFNSPKARKPIWTSEEAIPEDFLRIDIIFDVVYSDAATMPDDEAKPEMVKRAYVKYKGLPYEDSVWESPPLPVETARWSDFKLAFEDWAFRDTIYPPSHASLDTHLSRVRARNFETELLLRSQPELMIGGELMEYQLDGVNWLYYMFLKQINCILADDMGLGKTIQVIGLFATLVQKHGCWPFLVVAPNSTCQNWRREIKRWAPKLRVVTYCGSSFTRHMARNYEMFTEDSKDLRCHVVIASYESMVDVGTTKELAKIKWAGLVVDEGQRLKNDKSQLYERLQCMKFGFRTLLTGTPLQNNIRELFNLIQFIDPQRNAEQLEEEYGDLTSDNIRVLHEMIRPFFLRRTKAEVLPFLPPMVQIIVPVSMSVVQKKLYKSILGKNPDLIKAIFQKQTGQIQKSERYNLNNILMQLRKCLCHPFVYNRNIEEKTPDPVVSHQHLVEASGKLLLLGLMLPNLRERGHRVLISSQFLANLDIVEDFLDGLGLNYRRLDGSLSSLQKQIQIDDFNAPDSPYFAFLLSTRSGGVGINLASADTVIIMDPDFNPKQDMQALSRAHRIGQKNTVLVFQLITRATVEERIMQKGKKKLALDHVLIQRMEDNEDEEDLESILRHGADALFNDDDSADIIYTSECIDRLLDRSQAEQAEKIADDTTSTSTEQPQFNFARIWQNHGGTLEEVTEGEDNLVDTTLWDRILQEREREAAEEANRKAEALGRGKRKRRTVNYRTKEQENDGEPTPVKRRKTGDLDREFEPAEDEGDETDTLGNVIEDAMDLVGDQPPLQIRHRPFVRVRSPPPARPMVTNGAQDPRLACAACKHHHCRGRCPLKFAGVEHCPLCGLVHFGQNRSCPHLQSESQVRRMLVALSKSTEPPEHVTLARRYLRGILGHLTARARQVAMQHSQHPSLQGPIPAQQTGAPVPSVRHWHGAPTSES